MEVRAGIPFAKMGDHETVNLPPSTDIVVKGFANASYTQRITITPPQGQPIVFQGSGEGNRPIGITHFTTPAGADSAIAVVAIASSADGGQTWNPSDVYLDSCDVQAYNLTVIVSEDLADEDYNDAVCFLSWSGRDRSSIVESG
jgi:Fucose-binding lectin II (PA-IIL)